MSGVDRIIQRIREDARSAADGNLEKAREEARGIIKEAEAEALKKRKDMLTRAEAEAEAAKERLIKAARLDARKKELEVKQEIINEAFSRALQKLMNLPEREYLGFLAGMAADLARTGSEEIILGKRDRERLDTEELTAEINRRLSEKGVKGNVTLSGQEADIAGGFILRRGNVEINCSLETLVKTRRGELEAEVIGILFSE